MGEEGKSCGEGEGGTIAMPAVFINEASLRPLPLFDSRS